MLNQFLKNLSILKKFLFINFLFFTVIGLLTFLYLENVQPNLIKKKTSNQIEIINNTVENLNRLQIKFEESDIIIHLVDISHKNFEHHIDSVNVILNEIDCGDKKTIMVYNKIDKIYDDGYIKGINSKSRKILISARKKININILKNKLYDEISKVHIKRYPYNNFLFKKYD